MLELTESVWQILNSVNEHFNAVIHYQTDQSTYGQTDVWEPSQTLGDCEEYAIAKRDRLASLGMSISALRIATCLIAATGQGHAVLTVDTNRGTYVLDNNSHTVEPWKQSGCTFISRQAGNGSQNWVAVKE